MFECFITSNYEGAWIPFDGDRLLFRHRVQEFLRSVLNDQGELLVDKKGPHWIKGTKLAGLSYAQTGEWGVVVFSRSHAVGVDLEKQNRMLKKNYLELAKRFYHQLEFEQLKLISIFEGPTQFLRLWMMKEAYSKLQRLHLVEFINQAVSDKAVFEPLMKTRIGYQAIVARENY